MAWYWWCFIALVAGAGFVGWSCCRLSAIADAVMQPKDPQ